MSEETRTWRCPGDRLYHREHLWVKQDGDSLLIGISDYLQDSAGAILFTQLPAPGTKVSKGDDVVSLEAAKWVGYLKAPATGRIDSVNIELGQRPGLVNEDPYGSGWLLRLSPEGETDGDLMTAEDYLLLLDELAREEGLGTA